jgi:DNA polymerase III subunit epsilon
VGWGRAATPPPPPPAAGVARRGVPPMPVVDALRAGATTVLPGPGPLRGATPEEVRLLHGWLTAGGTRLVLSTQPWEEPARGAGSWAEWARRARPVEVPVD